MFADKPGFVTRDLAINGHTEPRFHNGKPVWRRDPQIEADALGLDDDTWKIGRALTHSCAMTMAP